MFTIFSTSLTLALSVFVIILLAVLLGKAGFISDVVDSGLMWLMVNVLFPCLIFDRIIRADIFSDLRNVWLPPFLGFFLTFIGVGIGFFVALNFSSRLTGLSTWRSKRTFAASVGILNYGFIPIPLVSVLFPDDDRTMGVLFLQYIGSEFSIWTLIIFCLYGRFDKWSLLRLINMPIIAIFAAVLLNLLWGSSILSEEMRLSLRLFDFLFDGRCGAIHLLGVSAVPISLLVVGLTISRLLAFEDIKLRWHRTWRTSICSVVIRLFIMPLIIFLIMILIPCTLEIKRILIIYGAMNSAVLTVALAKNYGGCEKTALDTIMSNSILSIITIPIWISLGFYILSL